MYKLTKQGIQLNSGDSFSIYRSDGQKVRLLINGQEPITGMSQINTKNDIKTSQNVVADGNVSAGKRVDAPLAEFNRLVVADEGASTMGGGRFLTTNKPISTAFDVSTTGTINAANAVIGGAEVLTKGKAINTTFDIATTRGITAATATVGGAEVLTKGKPINTSFDINTSGKVLVNGAEVMVVGKPIATAADFVSTANISGRRLLLDGALTSSSAVLTSPIAAEVVRKLPDAKKYGTSFGYSAADLEAAGVSELVATLGAAGVKTVDAGQLIAYLSQTLKGLLTTTASLQTDAASLKASNAELSAKVVELVDRLVALEKIKP